MRLSQLSEYDSAELHDTTSPTFTIRLSRVARYDVAKLDDTTQPKFTTQRSQISRYDSTKHPVATQANSAIRLSEYFTIRLRPISRCGLAKFLQRTQRNFAMRLRRNCTIRLNENVTVRFRITEFHVTLLSQLPRCDSGRFRDTKPNSAVRLRSIGDLQKN